MRLLWEEEFSLVQLPLVARRLNTELEKITPFCLWLSGELGAGKTALVRALLYDMGLSSRESVTSPTFTLLNEYEIGPHWYAHMDLYRMGALGSFEAEYREFRGFFIEWPPEAISSIGLAATHCVELALVSGKEESRKIRVLGC